MSLIVRALAPQTPVHQAIALDVLGTVLPASAVETALAHTGAHERRRRKLPELMSEAVGID